MPIAHAYGVRKRERVSVRKKVVGIKCGRKIYYRMEIRRLKFGAVANNPELITIHTD